MNKKNLAKRKVVIEAEERDRVSLLTELGNDRVTTTELVTEKAVREERSRSARKAAFKRWGICG